VLTKPRILLQFEGAALLFVSAYLYHLFGFSWWILFVLFLWPDLFMFGFLVNQVVGASLYNLVHTEILPIALAAFGFSTHRAQALAFSLIWLTHIGFDRAIGFGLKYPTTFNDTHLQHVA
jgi:hypothetical protein